MIARWFEQRIFMKLICFLRGTFCRNFVVWMWAWRQRFGTSNNGLGFFLKQNLATKLVVI